MKRKIAVLIAILTFFALIFCGCGETKVATLSDGNTTGVNSESEQTTEADEIISAVAENTDYEKAFAYILNGISEYINSGAQDTEGYDELPGISGISEIAIGGETDLSKSIGYAITDISGDGIPELLIGFIDNPDEENTGSIIYTLYSYNDGNPTSLFDGYYRSCYRYTGNGTFAYTGSGGAAYSAAAKYTLSEDGKALNCNDYYFTDFDTDNAEDIVLYYNTTGESDKSVSEKCSSVDILNDFQDEILSGVTPIELTPFADYNISD